MATHIRRLFSLSLAHAASSHFLNTNSGSLTSHRPRSSQSRGAQALPAETRSESRPWNAGWYQLDSRPEGDIST
jgi:hypothetical protein